jgi:uncharacterized membrane protein
MPIPFLGGFTPRLDQSAGKRRSTRSSDGRLFRHHRPARHISIDQIVQFRIVYAMTLMRESTCSCLFGLITISFFLGLVVTVSEVKSQQTIGQPARIGYLVVTPRPIVMGRTSASIIVVVATMNRGANAI